MSFQKVAVFGASGNFGTPITAALLSAGFSVTAISREDSPSTFPAGLPVVRSAYTVPALAAALAGQDAAVCVVGPGGIDLQTAMIDAAEAAGVRRFIIDDFGWGRNVRSYPEFEEIHARRVVGWDHARARAEENSGFSWTGISSGNPIDWAMKRFPLTGFDVENRSAIIYDQGAEYFTGTTLEGIGQSVVGVLQHPEETRNRFVKVMSIKTCQKELLVGFESVTQSQWRVQRATTKALLESAREKCRSGKGGWILEMVVSQLFDEGQARSLVAPTREQTDSELLGVREESAAEIAGKCMGLTGAWTRYNERDVTG